MKIEKYESGEEEEEVKDFSSVITRTAAFFSAGSPLRSISQFGGPAYEERPQQTEMALRISDALALSKNICVEAPTGVGKSFAYLVPAIYYALESGKPVIISTETINLQDQLINKDIPLIKKAIGLEFKAVLAKGRSNYLCMRRLGMASGKNASELLPLEALHSGVSRIQKWAKSSDDGAKGSIDFPYSKNLWEHVCSEVGNCMRNKCEHYKSCFYWRARKSWDSSDIIVANHALFFTDLKMRSVEEMESSLLPEYSALILDEAHKLEDEAAQHLGLHLSSFGVRSFLRKLYDPEKARGLLMIGGDRSMALRKTVSETLTASDFFFESARNYLAERNKGEIRIMNPFFIEDTITVQFQKLDKELEEFIKSCEDDSIRQEMTAQYMVSTYYSKGFFDFLNMKMPGHVYWIEGKGEGGGLHTAPVEIGKLLSQLLFSIEEPIVLTSATLSVNKSLDFYFSRIGFADGEALILDTPFDYMSQVSLYVPKMPLPDTEDYFDSLCMRVQEYIRMTHGKAFVLFTSYDLLKKSATSLRRFFDEMGIKLMIQGGDLPPAMMLEEFRRDTNSVIFGTNSFWSGVDVPGEALSNVIITKLPFSVPDQPIVQARNEKVRELGGNPFFDYQVPEAVLRFKQGTGRLIRRKSDKGIIVVLDRRIVSKNYGRDFLESLPPCRLWIE